MIQEQGTVVEVQAGRVRVQTQRSGACQSCKAQGGCSGLGGGREARLWVPDPIGLELGDKVVLAVPEATVVRASLLLYLAPVLALLAGAAVGDALGPRLGLSADLGAVLLGLLGMAAVLLAARRWGDRGDDGPRIVARG